MESKEVNELQQPQQQTQRRLSKSSSASSMSTANASTLGPAAPLVAQARLISSRLPTTPDLAAARVQSHHLRALLFLPSVLAHRTLLPPQNFQEKYPVAYEHSMHTVLVQELMR